MPNWPTCLVTFFLCTIAALPQSYPPNGSAVPAVSLNEGRTGAPNDAPPPAGWDQQSEWNMELVGADELQGRSTYQPVIVNQDGKEIAYFGHHAGTKLNPLTGKMEPNGTSILDVTDPSKPRYLFHIPGPAAKEGEVAGSQMVRVCSGNVLPHGERGKWYMLRTHGNIGPDESQEIYDVTNPAQPALLTTIVGHLSNTHKNWWECDTGIAYLVANNPAEGWRQRVSNQHLKIYDLSNPAHPVYIRDFGLPGQQPPDPNSSEPQGQPPTGIHGVISAGAAKNRVYMPYGVGADGIIQIIDRKKLLTDFTSGLRPTPQDLLSPQVGVIHMSPDQGGHSAFPVLGVPIPEFQDFSKMKKRDLLIVTSEVDTSAGCEQSPHMAFILDITNESTPWPISTLRVPEMPGDFCNKGGPFGSHGIAESFYPPYYGKLAIIAWFNAGVRVWDIRDPFAPRAIAYFIPAPNHNTTETCLAVRGTKTCHKAIQTNNVEVDDRGLLYAVDRAGTGLHILRLTGAARDAVENKSE